jgi:hypothetical protein
MTDDSTGTSSRLPEISRRGLLGGAGIAAEAAVRSVAVATRASLVIEQYEEWRTDGRPNSATAGTETGLRLVHQDVIPLG